CNALLGYLPDVGEISAFEPADEPTETAETGETLETAKAADKRWRSLHPEAQGQRYRQCHNYAVENVCNWMILADSPDTLCRACQFTET
ncbi:zinc-ribbon domain-containing protein, partial [Mycobacterium tuberculosis]|nr:zinc-ribbon domain-containing protein [Mycobacterium tuberculosis]